MAQEIAVCIGENGATSPIYDASTIVVYQQEQGSWQLIREQKISLNREGGLAGLRKQMADIILFLGDCKIFVGGTVVGVPYFELEKLQCSIWEFEGAPSAFLDYVLAQEEHKLVTKEVAPSLKIPVPVERENGDFYISIKEVQENGNGITSKQVLLPVLGKGNFYSLEILCNHIPPWLEAELTDGKLVGRVEKKSPTETHVYVTKRGCEK